MNIESTVHVFTSVCPLSRSSGIFALRRAARPRCTHAVILGPRSHCALAAGMMSMMLAVGGLLGVGFMLFVCAFGGSSSGVVGDLHNAITGCTCLQPLFRRLCGPRCQYICGRVEHHCCWRPNPLLQLFYVGLMGGGFFLFSLHSLPLIPNQQLPIWHRYSAYTFMMGGVLIFVAASFCDPGVVTAATLQQYSHSAYDHVVSHPMPTKRTAHPLGHQESEPRQRD